MIGDIVGVLCAVFLLCIVAVITLVIWALGGPFGVLLTYGVIIGTIMLVRSEKKDRIRRTCDELGITEEEYRKRLQHAKEEAAVAEWQSLSKGEKISRRQKQRYWEIWGK